MNIIQFSIRTVFSVTTILGLGLGLVIWISNPTDVELPLLLKDTAKYSTVGLIFAPICFMSAVFGYVAYGVFRQPPLYAGVAHAIISVAAVLSIYGVRFNSLYLADPLLPLERCVVAMFAILGFAIVESLVRREMVEHAIANGCMLIASCCAYLYWATVSVVQSTL